MFTSWLPDLFVYCHSLSLSATPRNILNRNHGIFSHFIVLILEIVSIGIYTCLRFIKLWKTNQLYKFNFRKISLILNKIKINLFQSILCYSNYKNICRNKLCNKLCTLALPLTFKMNAIKILILISNGGKIYILSPSEKNGYIS